MHANLSILKTVFIPFKFLSTIENKIEGHMLVKDVFMEFNYVQNYN